MGMQICASHSGNDVHFGENIWRNCGAVGHYKGSRKDFAADTDERPARKKATGESPNLQMLNSDLQLLPQIHVAQRSLRTGVTLPKRTLGWIAELDFVVLLYRRFFHQKHQELRSRSSSTTLVQVTRYSFDIFVPPYRNTGHALFLWYICTAI